MTIEELSNFTIIYDNRDTILTDYMVYSDISLNETEFIKKKNFFNLNSQKEKITKLKFDLESSIFYNDISKNIIKKENQKLFQKVNYNLGKIQWDYNLGYSIKYKADIENKINVYFVYDFSLIENKKYNETIYNCVNLFDNNN